MAAGGKGEEQAVAVRQASLGYRRNKFQSTPVNRPSLRRQALPLQLALQAAVASARDMPLFRIFALVASTPVPVLENLRGKRLAFVRDWRGCVDVLSKSRHPPRIPTVSPLTPPHIAPTRPAWAASSPPALSQLSTPHSTTSRRLVGLTLRNAPAADPTSSRPQGPLSRTHEPDSTVNLILVMLWRRLRRSTCTS